MSTVLPNIPGVLLRPDLLRERVEFTCEASKYAQLEPGDIVMVDGRELRVEQATFYSDGTARIAATVPLPSQDLPIRSSVRAHRRAVELLRDMMAEKFPGIEFSDEFFFHLVSLTRHIGNVTIARVLAGKMSELGMEDKRLIELADLASQELTHKFSETFRLWPGASEGKPQLPNADQ